MDLITQGILGAAVGQVAGVKKLGRKAIVAGAIGGLIPDLDVLFKYFFLNGEMLYHRGFTHSLWFGPLLGTVLGYLLYRHYKKSLFSWTMVMVWSLLTHPLLDLFTVYGTQLFAPFSNQRFSIPAVPIIDLFYSLPLLMGITYGWCFSKNRRMAQLVATILLTITTGYLMLGYRHNCLAETYARESLINQGFRVGKINAFPTILQIYLRRIVVHCRNQKDDPLIKVGYLSTWNIDSSPTITWETKVLNTDHDFSNLQNHPMLKLFTWFAEEQVFMEKVNDAVFIRDVRYGFPGSPPWGLWAMRFYPAENSSSIMATDLSQWQYSFERAPLSFNWKTVKNIYKMAFTPMPLCP